MLVGEVMKDFFTRRYDDKYKYSLYYLENQKQLVCKARRTIFSFSHRLSLEICGVEQYRMIRTKGSAFKEFIMMPFGNYKNFEFTIMDSNESYIGHIKFNKKKCFELFINGINYVIKNHNEGYFSIKENDKQIALFKKEPIAKCFYNRYCVWYEPRVNKYIHILLLTLSVNDYMFYCNDWSLNTKKEISSDLTWRLSDYASVYPSLYKANAPEIYWRPSDYNDNIAYEDTLYLEKIKKLQKKVNGFAVLIIILFIVILVFISMFL